ncbi:MAG: ankyrin repeat domain-containing protein [Deltaproteobacteria bacterium]|nr:ankyrin repeat domain-containing protein [Deltaproteobacteria bacterium]
MKRIFGFFLILSMFILLAGCMTPLMNAVKNGDINTVNVLLDKGVDVNESDINGFTALMWAAMDGNAGVVKILIERGANVDIAIAGLELGAQSLKGGSNDRAKALAGVKMLKSLTEKANIPRQSIISDIDKPSFNLSEIIMRDNDLAVIIGIEGYQGIPKSDYSYDDAKLVGDYAKAMGFKPRNIELLL